jgi:hypothetical protein
MQKKREGKGGGVQSETRGAKQQVQARGARNNKITSIPKRYLNKEVEQEEQNSKSNKRNEIAC